MSNLLGLNEVADFIMGQAPHSSTYNESGEGDLLIKAGDFGQLYPEPTTFTTSPIAFSRLGDVIMCVVGATSGKVNLGINASITRSVAALRPKNVTDTKYLYHLLKGSYQKLNRAATGSAQGILNKTSLSNFKIPLPPLEEQKKIAAILNAADEYRQKTKVLIDKYDQLTQSLFLEMFGDPVTNPMGWEAKKLGRVHKISSGGTPSRKNPEYYSNGTIPWVKTGELKGMYALSPSEYITEAALNNSSAKLFPANTLLIAMYGATIGACSILNIEAATNQACAALIPTDEANVLYEYFFFSLYKNELIKLGVGGAQPNISAGILRSLNVMYPPLQLQNQFAERIVQIEQQKQQAEASLVKAEELFSSLLQRAFKGELTS